MDAGFDEGIMQVDSLNKETIHFFLLLPNFPSRPYIARQNPQPPLNWISLIISLTLHSHHHSNVMNSTAICLLRWKMLKMVSFGGMKGALPSLVYHIWPVITFQFLVSMFKFLFFNISYLWTIKLLPLMWNVFSLMDDLCFLMSAAASMSSRLVLLRA